MSRYLYLYTSTPNELAGIHYLNSSFANFVSHLGLRTEVSLDNYRINEGKAKIKLADNVNFKDIKYIVQYDTETDEGFGYFVRSAKEVSGFVDFDLQIDNWGSYIHDATFEKIHVLKSNRNIGYGIYDEIAATSTKTNNKYQNTLWTSANLAIVFTALETTDHGEIPFLPESDGTTLRVYAYNITDTTGISAIKTAVDLISGIAKREVVSDTDASVIITNMWVVPQSMINTTTTNYTFKSYSNSSTTSVDVTGILMAGPYYNVHSETLTVDPDYKYYVGTTNYGMKIRNTTESATITYEFITKYDGLMINLYVGDDKLDITDAFSVGFTTNASNINSLNKLSAAINSAFQFGGSVGSMAGGIASANPIETLSGATSIVSSGLNMLQKFQSHTTGTYKPAGNAFLTYAFNGVTFNGPYSYQKFLSERDEQLNARNNGVSFDEYITSLGVLDNYSLIGSASGISYTYVQADCTITGIPLDAATDITNQLRNGIMLYDYT